MIFLECIGSRASLSAELTGHYRTMNSQEGVQKVFGTLDLFVSLLETEIKYPILQGGILPFWTPSFLSPYVCPGHHLEERTGNPDRSTDSRVT